MKTYRVAGTATDWSPSGDPQTVTRLETVTGPGGNSYSLPIRLSLRGETNRKGVRRVMIQAMTTIPGRVLNDMVAGINVDPNGQTPVSAHIVVQGPQLAIMNELGASTATGVTNLVLAKLLSDILAVAMNKSPDAQADNKSITGLLGRALAGSSELDVVSGSYGTTSA